MKKCWFFGTFFFLENIWKVAEMPFFCMREQVRIRSEIHEIEIDTTHTSQERIREQIQNHKKCHAGKAHLLSMVILFLWNVDFFVKSAHWPFNPKKSRCFRYFLHFPYDFLTAKHYPVNCSRFTYSCFICIEECTYRFKVILASACPSNSLSVFASNPWAIQSVA